MTHADDLRAWARRIGPPLTPLTGSKMDENLPTFEDMRSRAFALLGDVEDELRSDWRQGAGPNHEQAGTLQDARRAIREAKAALDRAGR